MREEGEGRPFQLVPFVRSLLGILRVLPETAIVESAIEHVFWRSRTMSLRFPVVYLLA